MSNPFGSNKIILNPCVNHLNYDQKCGLTLSIIPSIQLSLFANSLCTGGNKENIKSHLKRIWNIKDPISATNTLEHIMIEGKRITYNILLPYFLNNQDKISREKALKEQYMSIELLIKYINNLSDNLLLLENFKEITINQKELVNGILANDMSSAVTISRMAYDCNYLTDEQAWKYILLAWEKCHDTFKNWDDIFNSYIIGEAQCNDSREAFKQILNDIIEIKKPENSFW